MSDLDNRLIIEAMSRRGFLGTLGKAAAAAGINPKLPIPNLKDDDDDYDPIDEYERFDFDEWFEFNVRDIIVDNSIGDNKISNPLADKIELMVADKVTEGGQLSVDLMNLFDKHADHAFNMGIKFYEALEDPEIVEDIVSDLSNEVITQLNLKQIFANAAAREQRGDKQEDILKDVKAEINNPIEYSKFDTAGGTKDYNYTADSFIMSDKDSKLIAEAYLNEFKNIRNYIDDLPTIDIPEIFFAGSVGGDTNALFRNINNMPKAMIKKYYDSINNAIEAQNIYYKAGDKFANFLVRLNGMNNADKPNALRTIAHEFPNGTSALTIFKNVKKNNRNFILPVQTYRLSIENLLDTFSDMNTHFLFNDQEIDQVVEPILSYYE